MALTPIPWDCGLPSRTAGKDAGAAPAGDFRTVVAGDVDGVVWLWDLDADKKLRKLKKHADWVRCLALSPDGQLLASGGDDERIFLSNLQRGDLLQTFKTDDEVMALCFSPTGFKLIAGDSEGLLTFWHPGTGESLGKAKAHDSGVRAMRLSPDGRLLVTGGDDDTVKLWRPGEDTPLSTLHEGSSLMDLDVDPSGASVAVSADDEVKILDVSSGEVLSTLSGHDGTVNAVAFSPDGRYLATADEYDLRIWSVADGELVKHVEEAHDNTINGIAFTPDGRQLGSCSDDGTVQLWPSTFWVNDEGKPRSLKQGEWVQAFLFAPAVS